MANLLAKEAARGASQLFTADPQFADVTLFKSSSGDIISDLQQTLTQHWWGVHRREGSLRRSWLARLYPDGVDIDWKVSSHVFRLPVVSSGMFIFAAGPAVQKWTAQARSGALATQARLLKAQL